MGIVNFFTYVEKALKWTVEVHERNHIVNNCVLSAADSGDSVVNAAATSACDTKVEYGICVDMSSFFYSSIVEEIILHARKSLYSHIDSSSSETVGGKRKFKSAFDESEAQENLSQTTVADHHHHCQNTTEKSETRRSPCAEGAATLGAASTDLVLDDRLIDTCAYKCFQKLFNVIGAATIEHASYFTLHFDENTTSCKWFEQRRRRDTAQLVVNKVSKRLIFVETVKLVYKRLLLLYDMQHEGLDEEPFAFRPDSGKSMHEPSIAAHKAVRQKMQLPSGGQTSSDDQWWQRYSSGEGEWKCFYGIRDVECENNGAEQQQQQQKQQHHWYVYGNDSDIGLGMLLYTTANTKVHYVSNAKRIISFPNTGAQTDINAYKALHFFALSLLGNDFVPRMVNESANNIIALGEAVERMIASQRHPSNTYIDSLAGLFVESADKHGSDECETSRRVELARAIAYVLAELLLAVYDVKRSAEVEDLMHRRRSTPRVVDASDPTSLRCRDGKSRSFTECFATYALRTLWYLSYCLFYLDMDVAARHAFRREDLRANNRPLTVRRLPMKNHFYYNEPRLQEAVQFGLSTVTDVGRAIRNTPTHKLLGLMEKGILEIMNE